MQIRTRVAVCLSALMFFAGAAVMSVRAADSPEMGTWKLNEAKSKIGKGMPKNNTVVYATAGDSVKVTVDGVEADGKPSHNEWTGKFDGKDYPLTGDPTSDTRCYTRVDSHTLKLVNKKRRQDNHQRHSQGVGRWKDPHGNDHCDRRGGEEINVDSSLRQAITTAL